MGFAALYAGAAVIWLLIREVAVPFRIAVGIAVVLRLLVIAGPPTLSGDVYRYLWDGSVLRHGVSPYRYPPSDARLTSLRQTWHARINHPEIRTIYPPHAELLFAFIPSLLSWRVLLIGCDVGILWMLRDRRSAPFAWATFPPAIVEGAWSGHLDLAVGLALLFAVRNQSAVGAGVAAGLKVLPLAAWPALARRSATPGRFLAIATAVAVLPAIPFLFAGPVMAGMRDYSTRWVFNSPLFSVVSSALERFSVAARLKDGWTSVKDVADLEAISRPVYASLHTDFLARVTLLFLACAVISVLVAARRSISGSVGALLLCAPAIHPWYWLVMAPVAMWEGARVWIAVALCAPLSYLLYDGVPPLLVAALCYALPVLIASIPLSGSATSAAAGPASATLPRTARGTSPS